MFGFPLADFTRSFISYSYEDVKVKDLNPLFNDPTFLQGNPFLADALLIGEGGKRTISRITPSIVHNTVDNPIFPNTGKRLTASMDLAVLGGNTQFYKPRVEGVLFMRHTSRSSIGMRGQVEYIRPTGNTTTLPIFERLFLGGEYSVRGYTIRSIGPTVPESVVVLGGNKSLLMNLEYMFSIASQVRLVAFYDAGQVRDFGQAFGWKENLTQVVPASIPALFDPFATSALSDPSTPRSTTQVIGQTSAFKTSTGIELRFFMPVLNVPFRLIYSYNPQRAGVLDNNLQPTKATTFRFAVGTTF
jgi:outer membrane protein insertion porin family